MGAARRLRGACEALDGDPREWATSAAVTSSFVGPACADACALALRVHGGIGFTWDNDTHLWFKRAKSSEVLLGDASYHRELMMQNWTA